MYGYSNPALITQLVRDHQDRLRIQAGHSHTYREKQRLRVQQRTH
jgi:hypothetical protein